MIIWLGIIVEVLTSLDKRPPKFTSRMTARDTDMHPTMTSRAEAFSTLTTLVTNIPTLVFTSFCELFATFVMTLKIV